MHEAYRDDFASVAVGDRDRLISPAIRRMAGAAVFLGLVAAMGLWSYRLGTRDAAEVPVIRAMEGPLRVQPEEPGGVQAAHQGLEVNAVLAGTPAPEARPEPVASAAPQPAPTVAEEDAPQGALIVAAARAFAEAPDEATELQMPRPDGLETVEVSEAPDLGALVAEALEVEGAATETAALEPEAAAPSARPRSRPGNLERVRAQSPAAPAPTQAAAPVRATPAPTPAAPVQAREVASVTTGSRLVQLGAYDSEDLTRRAWSQMVARHPDLFSGKSLHVERATSNSRVFYRLRVAGFSNTEETRVMCENLRARSVDCIPVTVH